MVRAKHSLILATSILLLACGHEKSQLYPIEFKDYVDEFFYQANLRDQNLHEEDLDFIIQFGETQDVGAAGSCKTPGNVITIRPEAWELFDHRKKEWLMFHELGHCILDRDHKNDESLTGECYSYMKGIENNFKCSINYYSDYWRKYYLDELFDETTPLPGWYQLNQDYFNTIMTYKNSLIISDTIVDKLEIDTFTFSDQNKFLFEIEFYNSNTVEHSVRISIGNLSFSNCDICTGTKTRLYSGNNVFYSSADIGLNSDVKLSIFRNNEIVSFYINEYFIHTMEFSIIEGNKVKTNSFDDKLRMSIKYLYN